MLPAMPRRLPSLALAGAALAAVVLPLSAQAAGLPNISVWSGKTKKKQDPVTMYQTAPGKAAFFNLTVQCKIPGGTTTGQTLTLHGVPKNGKLNAKTTKALNSGASAGTLSVTTTAAAKHKAVGKVSWALPAALGGCKGSDTYSLKYSVSHGG
jgi:hypothetical protein